jgi:hypothetical protein
MIFSIASPSGKPQFAHRAGWNGNQLEKEQAEINASLADGSLFISDADKAMTLSNRLTEIDELLLEKLERWEELENLTK